MFNVSSFNRTPFNRLQFIETFLSATFETSTEMSARLSIEFPVTIAFETSTDVSANMTRELSIVTEAIETSTEILTSMIRQRIMSASIDTATEISVKVTHAHVDQLRFTGELKPGDKLVVDTKKMTVTLNGQNAIHLVDGDFFDLVLGTNKFTYSDSESARNILTRITHRDKYLY